MIQTMVPMIISRKDNGPSCWLEEKEASGSNPGLIPGFVVAPSDSVAGEAAGVNSSVASDCGAGAAAVISEAATNKIK